MSHAAADAEEIRKHTRVYLAVFAALAALTVVTVAVAYLDLPVVPAIVLALAIATVKGSLVALHFMHLIDERKAIYWTLALTGLFFVLCMMLPVFTVEESATHAPFLGMPTETGAPAGGGGHH